MTFSESKVEAMTKKLFAHGILVAKIIYSTAAKELACCQVMVSAVYIKEQLDFCLTKI